MDFRPNVALLLVRADGKLLICERLKTKGAWQFPQGGVDKGESFDEALAREVSEEIGVSPEQYRVKEQKGGYRYVFPPGAKKSKKRTRFAGQEQTYYLCELLDEEVNINIEQKPREFRDYKWINPNKFQLSWLPEFKHEVYRAVFKDFFEVTL